MQRETAQKDSVRTFWHTNSSTLKDIKSIDEIYKQYVAYVHEGSLVVPPINKYIFRTMIRKLGYKNS